MSPDDKKFDPANLRDLSLTDTSDADGDEDEEIPQVRESEIATRLHLLGKLIIPRSAP